MAVGDSNDFIYRLKNALPTGWFAAGDNPVLEGLLSGSASVSASAYQNFLYDYLQTRIATATDFNLDIIAYDFFGLKLSRRPGETDANFSARIRANLFLPKGTRTSVSMAITNLTGNTPRIIEPRNPSDTGGYGSLNHKKVGFGCGFNKAGAYGSLVSPYQAFVTVKRQAPVITPTANINGFNGFIGGYNVGRLAWASRSINTGTVTDDEIYQTIHDFSPCGTIAWVRITE